MTATGRGPRAPRRRRARVLLGLCLLLGGLCLLAYVGWEMFGTNVVAHHRQRALVQQLEESWDHPSRARGRERGLHGAEALVRIPAFGRHYVMPVLEGVGSDVLASGVGHYPGTAGPGEVGNYALAAHRVTHGEPFRHLPDLRAGDLVVVETAHAVDTYRLMTAPAALVVPFTAGWVIDPVPHNPRVGGPQPPQAAGQRLITLTTCSELFHTDNRMVAFGVLQSHRAKAGRATRHPL